MSPQLRGFTERKHRPLFTCTCCSEAIHSKCPRCGLSFCQAHGKDHDCVALLRALADRRLKWLLDYGDRVDALGSFAEHVVSKLQIGTRWPCPDCGRAGPDAPLRLIAVVTEDGCRYTVGCMRCVDLDPLLDEAAELLEEG